MTDFDEMLVGQVKRIDVLPDDVLLDIFDSLSEYEATASPT